MIFERMPVEYGATESFGFYFYMLNSDNIDHYYLVSNCNRIKGVYTF